MKRSQHSRRLSALTLGLALSTTAPLQADVGTSGWTELLSFQGDGSPLTHDAQSPSASGDGRYVAFTTKTAMLPEDMNGAKDIYVLDRDTGKLVCASKNIWGEYGNGDSTNPAMSADGDWVAFATLANNLGGIDGNGTYDVYLRDLKNWEIRLVSHPQGSPGTGNDSSSMPSVSDDGRFVAYQSRASNFVPGDSNGHSDIFVHDHLTGAKVRISVGMGGFEANGDSYAPSISGNGRKVSFFTAADNMHPADNNNKWDVFVQNLELGTTTLVSRGLGGGPANDRSYSTTISSDGTQVLFHSLGTDIDPRDMHGKADVYHHDLTTGAIELVSVGHTGFSSGDSVGWGKLARNGRYVTFATQGALLPEHSGNIDAYVRDLVKNRTWLVSRPDGASELSDDSTYALAITTDGSKVFMESAATLDPADANAVADIYVRTMIPDPKPYCTAETTFEGCLPKIAMNGFPSASQAAGFGVMAANVPPNRAGMFFYGFSGRDDIPFKGGTLCVAAPLFRGPVLHSGSNGAGACSGQLAIDMNAFAAGAAGGNPHPALSQPGQQVHAQFWGRDHPTKHGAFLSKGIQFMVGP